MHKHGYEEDPEALAKAQSLGYEPRDIDNTRIGRIGVMFALFIIFSIIAGIGSMMVIYWGQARGPVVYKVTEEPRRKLPPGPLLQSNYTAKKDIENLRRAEHERLSTAGIDSASGAHFIPIDSAIDILARKGLSDPTQASAESAPVRGTP